MIDQVPSVYVPCGVCAVSEKPDYVGRLLDITKLTRNVRRALASSRGSSDVLALGIFAFASDMVGGYP